MNLNPITTRNPKLAPINPHERRQNLGTFMVVRKNDIYVSVSLMDQIGHPDYIEFAADAGNKIVGFKKSEKDSEFAVKIYKNGPTGAKTSCVKSVVQTICDMLELGPDATESVNIRLAHPTAAPGGYCCFDMKFAEIENKRKVKRKNEPVC